MQGRPGCIRMIGLAKEFGHCLPAENSWRLLSREGMLKHLVKTAQRNGMLVASLLYTVRSKGTK